MVSGKYEVLEIDEFSNFFGLPKKKKKKKKKKKSVKHLIQLAEKWCFAVAKTHFS